MMKSDHVCVLRDLEKFQTVTDILKEQGLSCEYQVLETGIIDANRFISRMLRIPLASEVFYLKKIRTVEGVPKSIEKTYTLYEKVKGIRQSDLETHSFYEVIQDRFGYAIRKSEEEILIVTASAEEQKLLECQEQELLMNRGTTYLEGTEPFEYFEIITVSDFYRFRSVTETNGV